MSSEAKVAPEGSSKKEEPNIDAKLQQGPIEERGCTDCFCLLLFILGIGLLWYIAIFGWS